jgi:predicted ATPase
MKPDRDNLRFVITGGPGFGKTSLIDALGRVGFKVYKEAARTLIASGLEAPIRSEDARNGQFFDRILNQRLSDYLECTPPNLGFFDRGLPDSIAFTRFMGGRLRPSMLESITMHPYNPLVFITPAWPEIYTKDDVRTEDLETASKLHGFLLEVYGELGYSLVELPKTDIGERVDFILSSIDSLLGYKVIDNISLLE